jgi:two-component system, cell cycle sensor histidine kinase and response regulator CckA
LLTDMVMPQMNGSQLAQKWVERCPSIKIMFMTGYSSPPVLAEPASVNFPVLSKPFTPDSLLRNVRLALAQRPIPRTDTY